MLACNYTIFEHAHDHISAKLGQIRDIKVSMEQEGRAGPVWAQNVTRTQELVYMHNMFLCAQANILATLCQIS